MSTKTLYNYVDLGLMDIRNIDLPEKVKCNTKARRVHANKRILDRSIDERSPRIDTRKVYQMLLASVQFIIAIDINI